MCHNFELVYNSGPYATSSSLDKVYICALEEESSFTWCMLIIFIILIIPIVLYVKLNKFICFSSIYVKGEENESVFQAPINHHNVSKT